MKTMEKRLSTVESSLIWTLKGQISEVTILERCLYWRGHYDDDVNFKTPLTVKSVSKYN